MSQAKAPQVRHWLNVLAQVQMMWTEWNEPFTVVEHEQEFS